MPASRALFALSVLVIPRIAAAERTHAFRLSYDVPAGCPAASEMTTALETSTARAHAADRGESAFEFGAEVVKRPRGFVGVLEVRRPDGTETMRAVAAATCTEAVSAMALVAAIVIDPDAAWPTSGGGAETPTALPATAPPTPFFRPIAAAGAVTQADAKTSVNVEATNRPQSLSLAVGAGVGVVGAIAPIVAPDYGVGVEIGLPSRGAFSPTFTLSGHWAESARVATTSGTAQFERVAGRLAFCPVRALGPPPLVLRPCAEFEAGTLGVSGSRAPEPERVELAWSAFGLTTRAEMLLFDRVSVGVEVGATFPLLRDRFYFDPGGVTVYRVDWIGLLGSIGASVRFF